VFDTAFQRSQRLRPLTVAAAVPEIPGIVGGSQQCRRPAWCGAETLGLSPSIGKVVFRPVAVRAGDFAVAAQAGVKKQLVPERRGARIVGDFI